MTIALRACATPGCTNTGYPRWTQNGLCPGLCLVCARYAAEASHDAAVRAAVVRAAAALIRAQQERERAHDRREGAIALSSVLAAIEALDQSPVEAAAHDAAVRDRAMRHAERIACEAAGRLACEALREMARLDMEAPKSDQRWTEDERDAIRDAAVDLRGAGALRARLRDEIRGIAPRPRETNDA